MVDRGVDFTGELLQFSIQTAEHLVGEELTMDGTAQPELCFSERSPCIIEEITDIMRVKAAPCFCDVCPDRVSRTGKLCPDRFPGKPIPGAHQIPDPIRIL